MPATQPTIQATCATDDGVVTVIFNAATWFEQATDNDIRALADIGWGGDYPADELAQFYAETETKRVFEHIANLQRSADKRIRDSAGYECRIDSKSAFLWLLEHKPHLVGIADD